MVLLGEPSPIVAFLMMSALFSVSLFLILLVLVQRGKGGGLTGALGGMGGQSAFGTKAGDVFTRLTIGTAIVWILLCLVTIQLLGPKRASADADNTPGMSATGGMGADTEEAEGDSEGTSSSDSGTSDSTSTDDSSSSAKAEADDSGTDDEAPPAPDSD